MNTIDPSKFDAQFVRWFNDVQKTMKSENSVGFEAAYPGYRSFGETQPKARPLAEWGDGPEMTLLGKADERRQFQKLTTDDERRAFIEAFWKRRDTTPDTDANELRDTFLKRAAFADRMWSTERLRGALSDRGRVFLLLGEPVVIRTKPLSKAEGASVRGGASAPPPDVANAVEMAHVMEAADKNMGIKNFDPVNKGSVERWYFARDQLPRSIPDAEVVFKFITEEGYGDHILQRDFMVNKVMHDAVPDAQ
jgi:GWxTD domain-containing protein